MKGRCDNCSYITEVEDYEDRTLCDVCANSLLSARHLDLFALSASIGFLMNVMIDALGKREVFKATLDEYDKNDYGNIEE